MPYYIVAHMKDGEKVQVSPERPLLKTLFFYWMGAIAWCWTREINCVVNHLTIRYMKPKPKAIINRDLGTKSECIADLRRAVNEANMLLDSRSLHTAIFLLETKIAEVKKKMPAEKIVKPFKH